MMEYLKLPVYSELDALFYNYLLKTERTDVAKYFLEACPELKNAKKGDGGYITVNWFTGELISILDRFAIVYNHTLRVWEMTKTLMDQISKPEDKLKSKFQDPLRDSSMEETIGKNCPPEEDIGGIFDLISDRLVVSENIHLYEKIPGKSFNPVEKDGNRSFEEQDRNRKISKSGKQSSKERDKDWKRGSKDRDEKQSSKERKDRKRTSREWDKQQTPRDRDNHSSCSKKSLSSEQSLSRQLLSEECLSPKSTCPCKYCISSKKRPRSQSRKRSRSSDTSSSGSSFDKYRDTRKKHYENPKNVKKSYRSEYSSKKMYPSQRHGRFFRGESACRRFNMYDYIRARRSVSKNHNTFSQKRYSYHRHENNYFKRPKIPEKY